jgi:hypothetical protein
MIGSKEFYELIENFEKNISYLPYGVSFEKEERSMWEQGQIYQNGQTNNYFKCFMLGYQFGKIN